MVEEFRCDRAKALHRALRRHGRFIFDLVKIVVNTYEKNLVKIVVNEEA